MRDALFPPSGVTYLFDNRLTFDKTFSRAAVDVTSAWLSDYGQRVLFDARDVRPLAFEQFMFFARGWSNGWGIWVGRVEDDGETYVAEGKRGYYVEILRGLANQFGERRVFGDVESLYYAVSGQRSVHDNILDGIRVMASRYLGWCNQSWAYNALSQCYYDMLATENDGASYLGRRVVVYVVGRALLCGDVVSVAVDRAAFTSAYFVDVEVQSWGILPDDLRKKLSVTAIRNALRFRA